MLLVPALGTASRVLCFPSGGEHSTCYVFVLQVCSLIRDPIGTFVFQCEMRLLVRVTSSGWPVSVFSRREQSSVDLLVFSEGSLSGLFVSSIATTHLSVDVRFMLGHSTGGLQSSDGL